MTKEYVIQVLMENQYTEQQANAVSNDILNLDEKLIPIFEKWASSGEVQDFSSNGLSISELMKRFEKMKFPAVLLTMDWVVKEPNIALLAIEQGIR